MTSQIRIGAGIAAYESYALEVISPYARCWGSGYLERCFNTIHSISSTFNKAVFTWCGWLKRKCPSPHIANIIFNTAVSLSQKTPLGIFNTSSSVTRQAGVVSQMHYTGVIISDLRDHNYYSTKHLVDRRYWKFLVMLTPKIADAAGLLYNEAKKAKTTLRNGARGITEIMLCITITVIRNSRPICA